MWFTPTIAKFQTTGLLKAEFDAITEVSLPDGMTGSEVLQEQITAMVDHVRGWIGMKGRTLGAEGTIPTEVFLTYTALLRREVFTRLPDSVSKKFFNAARQQAALEAVEALKRWSETTGGIVPPETPAPADQQPGSAGKDLGAKRTNRFDGLV
jgi:hypothetical protein